MAITKAKKLPHKGERPIYPEPKLISDIKEVAARYGFENTSKLRYWETQFPMLRPEKRGGDRIYNRGDIELLDEIVYLVEYKGHQLAAARQLIESGRSQRNKINRAIEQLETVKAYLEDLKEVLT
ncbi:MAG: MerR family transcriptional regulator [Bacteroidetes bacterium]|nr:MerR family transcriptional regulator [Bacteroidota bacterium]